MPYHGVVSSYLDTLDCFPFLCPTRALRALKYVNLLWSYGPNKPNSNAQTPKPEK